MSDAARTVTPRSPAARAAYLAYRSGGAVAQALPPRAARRMASTVSRAMWAAMADRRHLVERHMRRAVGTELSRARMRRLVRGVFASYAHYWVEAFRLPRETPESIAAGLTFEGLEHLRDAYDAGGGVILAAPHLGGWDFGGAWLAQAGFRPVAVAEVLEPPELFEWFVEWRRRLGVEIVAADVDAGPALVRALKDGCTVGLVSDRDILGSGVEVEFFGEVTTLPAGPATLALRTGAPLLPCAIYYGGPSGHFAAFRPPLDATRTGRFRDDVRRLTQALAHELEDLIRRHPEQWHLMQPNWPSDPGWDDRGAARPGAGA